MINKQLIKNRSIVKNQIREDVWCVSIVNHFRASFGKGESKKHRDKKYERWCYWREQGFQVVVEGILKNGLRPDLLIFGETDIWIEEIVNTEKEDSLIKKKKDYPFHLSVIGINDDSK